MTSRSFDSRLQATSKPIGDDEFVQNVAMHSSVQIRGHVPKKYPKMTSTGLCGPWLWELLRMHHLYVQVEIAHSRPCLSAAGCAADDDASDSSCFRPYSSTQLSSHGSMTTSCTAASRPLEELSCLTFPSVL